MIERGNELLSTKEVAQKLGITRRRVQHLTSKGRFPGAFKKGRDWLIPQRGLDAYIAAKQKRQTARA